MPRHLASKLSAGFTWIELIVVIIILAVVIAMLLPPQVASRETARRMACNNHLKQIGLALHNYGQTHKVFPPGTICSTGPAQPSNQYDVWAEAGQTGTGVHGTSFLLQLLPFIEQNALFKAWNYEYGVGGNATVAMTDVKGLYCPTRRNAVRPEDSAMMLSTSWTGGGTDYGGCAGRHAAFTLDTGYNLCDATMHYDPDFVPSQLKDKEKDDTPEHRWGIFGRVNVSSTFGGVRDGLSNTIMTGELQRLTDVSPGSKDGWAIGGPATLFTTGAMMAKLDGKSPVCATAADCGVPMNNGFFGSPGSEHANGANYGIADGSVRFLPTSMDPNVFALLGSMADGEKVEIAE